MLRVAAALLLALFSVVAAQSAPWRSAGMDISVAAEMSGSLGAGASATWNAP